MPCVNARNRLIGIFLEMEVAMSCSQLDFGLESGANASVVSHPIKYYSNV